MFNLSTTGNVGYNGISQLSESRCTTQYNNTIDRNAATVTSATKMRYANTGARTKYTSGFKMPLYSDVKNVSPDSRLKLSTANEDVYTFDDADTPVITSRTPNSFLKESLTATNKTDSVCTKKLLTGSLLTSPKKVHVAKQVNGFSFRKDTNVPELKNGLYPKANNAADTSTKIQNHILPPQRISVKPNKDLFEPSPFLCDIKTEPDLTPYKLHTDALNHSTNKNSITSYNVKPAKSVLISQDKKSFDFVVKKESGVRGTNGLFNPTILPGSSFKSNIKIPTKKIPSGKPLPSLSKVRRGRGPALHEALQRINPSPSSKIQSTYVPIAIKWHAPGSDLFDCGALDSSYTKVDSDSSDDYPSDCVEEADSDVSVETDDRSEKIVATRASLRRKINLLHQLEKISKYSESASKLYNSVKTQFKQKRRTRSGEGFRLESPALDMLLASQGTTSILSTADRRKIRSGGRLVEPVRCARTGCNALALACARLCLAHISLNPEQRLFAECTAKFSDNTQCRVPVVDVRNELPLCSEHTLKKDNYIKNVQELKPSRAPRKRSKSSSVRPSKRNHKKKSVSGSNDGGKFMMLNDDGEIFSSTNIESSITPGFLNHEETTELNVCSNSSICESSEDTGIGGLSENELIVSTNHNHNLDPDVVAEVLAMDDSEDLPSLVLPPTDPPQEPNIDLSTVFNDFFTEQNGEYIPTREETEELERALEAVNQDVKSLEKLTNSEHSSLLLDTLLDDRTLAETLASFPDVFSNIPPIKVTESIVDPTSSSS